MATYLSYNPNFTPNPIRNLYEILPEDVENADIDFVVRALQEHMKEAYPEFEPEIIHSLNNGVMKEYYLPALKVLHRLDGEYYSPSKVSHWRDMELEAVCMADDYRLLAYALTDFVAATEPHTAPGDKCECGIYGTVNLDEALGYMGESNMVTLQRSLLVPHWDMGHQVLAIVEPSEGAKVMLARKGWKASKAFISEIVGETISPDDASNLLSLAWHRPIDVRRIYESR